MLENLLSEFNQLSSLDVTLISLFAFGAAYFLGENILIMLKKKEDKPVPTRKYNLLMIIVFICLILLRLKA